MKNLEVNLWTVVVFLPHLSQIQNKNESVNICGTVDLEDFNLYY
jgi:hypothetical protein